MGFEFRDALAGRRQRDPEIFGAQRQATHLDRVDKQAQADEVKSVEVHGMNGHLSLI
jgi:hypothetical protein